MKLPAVTALILAACLATGCAGRLGPNLPQGSARTAAADLAAQRRAVDVAIADLERQYGADLQALEARGDAAIADAALERLLAQRHAARNKALGPLVAQGNAEAMYRLAWDVRDQTSPRDVARWFELITSATRAGHPLAHDELVRWWWHQKGDGSITAVQRYRARALQHAEAAADAGHLHTLERIAVYIAGDVHQYPASLPLARALMRLCAQGGHAACQERLALVSSYAFPETPEERYFWLAVQSRRKRAFFADRMEELETVIGADRARTLRLQADAWKPTAWSKLRADWRPLRDAILGHGASSVGVYGACSTSTPWCRGDIGSLTRALKD